MYKNHFELLNAKTIIDHDYEPMRFFVDGLVPEGITLLAGLPKAGKSWLALDLAVAVSQGKPFLGKTTERSCVLYLALEDSERRIHDRIKQISGPEDDLSNLYFSTTSPRLGDGLSEEISNTVLQHAKIRLIVIDVFQRIRMCNKFSRAAAAYSVDYEELGALRNIVSRFQVSILLNHHLRKSTDEFNPFNEIHGSNGLTGSVDTMLVLKKNQTFSNSGTLYLSGRDVETDEFKLLFNNCRWRIVDAPEPTSQIPPVLTKIVRMMNDRDHWEGSATELLRELEETSVSPAGLTKLITKNYFEVFVPAGIIVSLSRSSEKRLIRLKKTPLFDNPSEPSPASSCHPDAM